MCSDAAAVNVVWPAISRQLKRNGYDGVVIVFRPARGAVLTDDLLRLAGRAVLAANEAVPPETIWGVEQVSPSVHGPVVSLESCAAPADMQRWLGAFAEAFERAGWSGTVSAAPQRWLPKALQDLRKVRPAVFSAYRIDPATLQRELLPGVQRHWGVAPGTTAQVCRHLVDWASFPGAEVLLAQGRSQVAVDGHDVAAALATSVNNAPRSAATYFLADATKVRRVALSYWGQAVYQSLGSALGSAEEHLNKLREALLHDPQAVDLGIVRPTCNWPANWDDLENNPTPAFIPYYSYRELRGLWDRLLPDAYGMQLVTGLHLARAHDLSDWRVQQLTADRFLVEAHDLDAWYANELVPTDVLAKARADFGSMIATPTDVEQAGR